MKKRRRRESPRSLNKGEPFRRGGAIEKTKKQKSRKEGEGSTQIEVWRANSRIRKSAMLAKRKKACQKKRVEKRPPSNVIRNTKKKNNIVI